MFKNFALLVAAITFGFCFYSLYRAKTPVFQAYADEYEVYLTHGSFGNNALVVSEDAFGALTEIRGESCTVSVSYEQVLEDFSAAHVFSEQTDHGENFYAYSPKIHYKTYIKGKAVNIHYHAGERENRLGTPLIFGGY